MEKFQSDIKKGIATRLAKATNTLKELEAEIKLLETGIDPKVLADFRQANDHIRLTAWAVQLWLEEEQKGHVPYKLVPLLTTERVKRATQLCQDLAGDMRVMQFSLESEGAEGFQELYRAVDRLHQPLTRLFTKKKEEI